MVSVKAVTKVHSRHTKRKETLHTLNMTKTHLLIKKISKEIKYGDWDLRLYWPLYTVLRLGLLS